MESIITQCEDFISQHGIRDGLYTSISRFRESQCPNSFADAKSIPLVFLNHLTPRNRIIKQIYSEAAEVKGFYYIYLRYIVHGYHSLKNQQFGSLLSKVFSPEFQAYLDDSVLTNIQLKLVLAEWTLILCREPSNLQKHLQQYPVMDTVFTNILKSICMKNALLSTKYSIRKQSVFQVLCKYLQIEYTSLGWSGDGFRLVDYEGIYFSQGPNNVYIGYTHSERDPNSVRAERECSFGSPKIMPLETIPQVVSYGDQSVSYIPFVANSQYSEFQEVIMSGFQSPKAPSKKLESLLKDSKQNIPPRGKPNKDPRLSDTNADFTNTFILKLIEDPFKANIQSIRNRVRKGRKGLPTTLF